MDESRFSALTTVPSRRVVLAAGGAAALTALAGTAPASAAYKHAQLGWRFCPKCRGLFFSPKNEALGSCPAGGTHTPRKDLTYVLYAGFSGANTYAGWRRCRRCAGLYSDLNGTGNGRCPKGGRHQPGTDGWSFTLHTGQGFPGVTDDAWTYCVNCLGQYNFAGGNVGACPAGGGHQATQCCTMKLVVLS